MKALLHLWKAYGFSIQGLRDTFKNELAFRIELTVAIVLIPTALLLPVSLISRVLLISSVLLVLIVELLNTGIEAVVNRISTEQHPLSGRAKDAGSAAVFVSAVNLACVWCIVLIDLIYNYY
ncbi:MAG: diacylglycerol kinase [SAR324 cluster bacterium]|nr:diacylglycerol kinase [SAR324 cluster bacterium]MBL7035913.1 diacylglycerol kinase [SAR324 cluster bacterium]